MKGSVFPSRYSSTVQDFQCTSLGLAQSSRNGISSRPMTVPSTSTLALARAVAVSDVTTARAGEVSGVKQLFIVTDNASLRVRWVLFNYLN